MILRLIFIFLIICDITTGSNPSSKKKNRQSMRVATQQEERERMLRELSLKQKPIHVEIEPNVQKQINNVITTNSDISAVNVKIGDSVQTFANNDKYNIDDINELLMYFTFLLNMH